MINLVNRRCRELLLRTGTPHEATQDQNGAQFAVELRFIPKDGNICELHCLFVCLFVCTNGPRNDCQCPRIAPSCGTGM